MANVPNAPAPERFEAQPQLYVADMAEVLDFWRDKLGFEPVFVYGEPPFYAQVARSGARLNLRLAPGPVFAAEFLAREVDPICATVTAHDVADLYEGCQAAGAEIHQALRREPWGAQTFIVRDPSGNLVLFAGA